MAFDLRALRYFVQVAQLNSLTKAARALNIAQPALSQQMANLENHLGVQLLVRSARGVELTQEGEQLLAGAFDILERARQVEQGLNQHSGELHGAINLGLPAPVANVVLERLVRRVRETYPDLRLRIEEARTNQLLDGLLSGHLDLAITANAGESNRIGATLIAEETLHLVGSAASGLGATIPFSDIVELPLVVSSRVDPQKSMLNRAANRLQRKLNVALESTSLATSKRLIADGFVYGLMTRSAVQEMLNDGSLVAAQITEPVLPRPIYLLEVQDRRHSRTARVIATEITALAADLAAEGVFC